MGRYRAIIASRAALRLIEALDPALICAQFSLLSEQAAGRAVEILPCFLVAWRAALWQLNLAMVAKSNAAHKLWATGNCITFIPRSLPLRIPLSLATNALMPAIPNAWQFEEST
jgi:hypothetical protein